ncbi:unnamed protein product [Clavelina lepadiformis]|uniref:Uncharacterized protein n=1 Tax=Clavelina lepadiformis TaxID=159417 RepID=A0ABP0GGE7_CLALP
MTTPVNSDDPPPSYECLMREDEVNRTAQLNGNSKAVTPLALSTAPPTPIIIYEHRPQSRASKILAPVLIVIALVIIITVIRHFIVK